ncbi:hypothetical protein WOLCODRAFT_159346 [Wolfiporia cocos MD-104 SS10]|uniref:Uncharacterized protein n=1 Tax=Wolfiporia cocos (strain MD-104) TaxID=742152 RepID=A0A2H3JIZ3_WOLCO|nr:hypothetical protein WOLCODRAFT_159346 [Wolfiporia cocos MD-104 SS10]
MPSRVDVDQTCRRGVAPECFTYPLGLVSSFLLESRGHCCDLQHRSWLFNPSSVLGARRPDNAYVGGWHRLPRRVVEPKR